MLTRLIIKNFKQIKEADISLDQNVVFIGPNNSGKTSALQALSLWEIGLKLWQNKKSSKSKSSKRTGIAINKKDLIALPVPNPIFLWNSRHVRNSSKNREGKSRTENVLINIIVEGVTNSKKWECGFEFDYANTESFYCRPAKKLLNPDDRYDIPDDDILNKIHVAFLPPMSGLASIEPKLEQGRINVLIGEGQTAQVLRNLCYSIFSDDDKTKWNSVVDHLRSLFGIKLMEPIFNPVRGEVEMTYQDRGLIELDLSSSGRGLQQTLLIIAYLYMNPQTIVLLDEPDAHLEILRQRQIYQLINSIAHQQNCQIVSASHSEIVLNEAVEKDTVVSFVGKPHVINDKGTQLLKSLKEIGFEDYYLAEEHGWILYLEGSTDLDILQVYAKILNHPVQEFLDKPFVKYMGDNKPQSARNHFYALQKEAIPSLCGFALFDNITAELKQDSPLFETMWSKREIENYFCTQEILLRYARGKPEMDLFDTANSENKEKLMKQCISEIENAFNTLKRPSPWSDEIKATDDFLEPLLKCYFEKLGMPESTIRKSSYYKIALEMTKNDINPEIIEKLDLIYKVAKSSSKSGMET